MILYFKRDDGGYSQVETEDTPRTAAEYLGKYEQISKEEFEKNVPKGGEDIDK